MPGVRDVAIPMLIERNNCNCLNNEVLEQNSREFYVMEKGQYLCVCSYIYGIICFF
jgi:hypothetical protein